MEIIFPLAVHPARAFLLWEVYWASLEVFQMHIIVLKEMGVPSEETCTSCE